MCKSSSCGSCSHTSVTTPTPPYSIHARHEIWKSVCSSFQCFSRCSKQSKSAIKHCINGVHCRDKNANKGKATLTELLSSSCATQRAGRLDGLIIFFFYVFLFFLLLCTTNILNVYNEKRFPCRTSPRSSICFPGQCQTLLG